MCSGRGYHVLGDFSFKLIVYEIAPSFVYLFMYLLLTVTSVYATPARACIHFLMRAVIAFIPSTWTVASR